MIPNVDETILHTEFSKDKDEFNLPQPMAHWIRTIVTSGSSKKSSSKTTKASLAHHYQFTDTIVNQSEMQSQFSSQAQSVQSKKMSVRSRKDTEQQYKDINDDVPIILESSSLSMQKDIEKIMLAKNSTSKLLKENMDKKKK